MKIISTTGQEWQRLCGRQTIRKRRIEERVRTIVDDVHPGGDEDADQLFRAQHGID